MCHTARPRNRPTNGCQSVCCEGYGIPHMTLLQVPADILCFWRRLVHAFDKPGPEAQTWIPKSGHVVCLPPHTPPLLRLSGVGPPLQSPPGVHSWDAAVAPRRERPWQPNSDRCGRALRRLNGAVSVQIRPPTPTILDCLRMTDVVTRLAWRRLGTRAHCSAPGARGRVVVRGHSE